MASLLYSPIFFKVCIILGLWCVGLVVLLTSTDSIVYTVLIVPFVCSFILVRRLLYQMELALHFGTNLIQSNIILYMITHYFCTFFMITCGILLVIQLVGTIVF